MPKLRGKYFASFFFRFLNRTKVSRVRWCCTMTHCCCWEVTLLPPPRDSTCALTPPSGCLKKLSTISKSCPIFEARYRNISLETLVKANKHLLLTKEGEGCLVQELDDKLICKTINILFICTFHHSHID